jgi:4-amino-4-deoxy-L-arabinose transferase-like glycosyltransferase
MFLLALFTGGTALRLWFNLAVHPPGDFVTSDMWVYDHRADHFFTRPPGPWDTFTPPGYPALLALIFRLCGRHCHATVGVVQAFMGGALAPLVFILARRLTGSRLVARVSGIGTALYFPLIFYGGLLMTEVPFALLLLLGTLALARAAADARPRWPVAAGVALAAATLVRPNLLVFLPLVAVHFWVARHRDWKAALRSTAFVLAGAVPLLAWGSLHNSRIAGRPVGLGTNGGLNFFLAHSDYRGATYQEGSFRHEIVPIPNLLRYERMYESPVPLYDEGHFYRAGIQRLARDPYRLLESLDNVTDGLGVGRLDYWPGWRPMGRLLIVFSKSAFWLLFLPATAYLVVLIALGRLFRPQESGRLLLFLVAYSVIPVLYLFLGDPRLRVPFDPLFLILTVDALVRARAARAALLSAPPPAAASSS